MTVTDSLWGGLLTAINFDPVSHDCQLHVEIIVDGMRSIRVMVCRGVTEFHFQNQIPNPWTYAEVTEVKADFDPRSDTWFLEMMLWSEDAGLTLRCVRIDMDGADYEPVDK
jgi:hypothetical protein